MLLSAILNYKIPNGDNGRVFVYGDNVENVNTIVLFCAGFPDDMRVFQPLAMRLGSSRDDMVCGVTCLPGYDRCQDSEVNWNYDMEDMAKCIKEATKALKTHVPTATKTVGIFHDWGCMAGSICSNMYTDFDALVYIDVLPSPQGKTFMKRGFSLKQVVYIPLYTSIYAFTNFLQRYVSRWLSMASMAIGSTTLVLTGLIPVKTIDRKTILEQYSRKELYSQQVISMMYPYYRMYKNMMMGRPMFGKGFYLNVQTPTLYLFGVNKPVHFHTKRDISWMGQYSHMKSVAVEQAGHWLYLQQPEVAFNEIDIFLRGI